MVSITCRVYQKRRREADLIATILFLIPFIILHVHRDIDGIVAGLGPRNDVASSFSSSLDLSSLQA